MGAARAPVLVKLTNIQSLLVYIFELPGLWTTVAIQDSLLSSLNSSPFVWALSDPHACLQPLSCLNCSRLQFSLFFFQHASLMKLTFLVCWTVATNFVVIPLIAGTLAGHCVCACRISRIKTSLQQSEGHVVVRIVA